MAKTVERFIMWDFEVLKVSWVLDGETEIRDIKVTPLGGNHYTLVLPRYARVSARHAPAGWRGYPGVTHLIEQYPWVEHESYTGPERTKPFRYVNNGNFLGRLTEILPDRTCIPGQLPEIFDLVKKEFRWEIAPYIKNLLVPLRHSRTRPAKIFAPKLEI